MKEDRLREGIPYLRIGYNLTSQDREKRAGVMRANMIYYPPTGFLGFRRDCGPATKRKPALRARTEG